MQVTLQQPVNGANIDFNSAVNFRWSASRPLQGNECFEAVFWQGGRDNALRGYGIEGAGAATSVTRTFNEAYQVDSDWLQSGSTYSWGVLLIEDCQAYRTTNRTLVSDVRTISYRK